MTFRLAEPEDARAIVEIADAGWRWAYAHIIPLDAMADRVSEERIARIGQSIAEGRTTILAVLEGEVAGFASIAEPCGWPEADFEVGGLYVRPSATRKGVGRALMAASAREGLARGRTRLAIHTLRDNRIGRDFYEKLGGRLGGEDDWGFGGALYRAVWYVYDDLDRLAEGETLGRAT